MGEVAHPIRDVAGVQEHVGLVRADVLHSLPVPWPRCQELPRESFGSPRKDDLVLAVSHAWQYQTHPDPSGGTARLIASLLADATAAHRPQGRAMLFYDFMSATQRPFARGQAGRTPQQQRSFAEALKAFPMVYLMADATLHVEVMCDPVPGDGDIYQADATELEGLDILQIDDSVRVISWPEEVSEGGVTPCDVVLSLDGKPVTCVADLPQDPQAPPGRPPSVFSWRCAPAVCGGRHQRVATLQRAPYGKRNTVLASLKGWVYLERFVSMVKAAMVPESQMESVAFSNSPAVLEQIFIGGRRLRAAAAGGQQKLQEVLQDLAGQLDAKRFSATSIDKAKNTGGVGGLSEGVAAAPSDRDMVFGLMVELVEHLARHWQRELHAQEQRQLVLAVSRGDERAVRDLLAAGVAVNEPDALGVTSLHVAAKFRHLEVAQILLAGGAALGCEDVLGNSPAHMVPLLSDVRTVPMFRLMAPTARELTAKNRAGITPLRRFQVWATLELAGRPFKPATDCLEELRWELPEAFLPGQGRTPEELGRGLPAVRETEAVCQVDGRTVRVRVFEPLSGEHGVDVLCLSLAFYVPPALAEGAVRTIAQRLSTRAPARVFCVGVGALSPASLSADCFAPLHADLLKVIDALPLREPFALLDSSLGEATALVWRLRGRLRAAAVVNLRGFHSDVFPGSDMCPKIVSRFEGLSQVFAERRTDDLAEMLADYAFAPSPQELESLACAYRAALRDTTARFFEHGAFHCRMVAQHIMERTNMFNQLGVLRGLPVSIACGVFSPGMWTLEAAPRLSALIQDSLIEHIPDDKSCWELEGVHQAVAVAEVLERLIAGGPAEADKAGRAEWSDEIRAV